MNWTRPIGLLGIAVLVVLTVGSLTSLVPVLGADRPALTTVALVALLVIGASFVGATSRRWRANPYW